MTADFTTSIIRLKIMDKLLLMALGMMAMSAEAAQSIPAPSANASAYTIVSIDTKKLKTSEAAALLQWPGKECKSYANLNGQLFCPGIWNDLNTYDLAEGFTKLADPNDPRKALRIDGLKQTFASNFFTVTFCPDPNNCMAPPAREAHFAMQVPTTEFGFEYRADRPDLLFPFIDGFYVKVNGNDLGFVPTQNPVGVQYFGISAPEGIQTLSVYPVWHGSTDTLGPLLIDRFFYK